MNNKQSRRDFLVRSGQLIASTGLLTKVGPSLWARPHVPPVEPNVITRALGKTGLTVPIVSLGFMNADNPGLIQRAYEVGVRHFDTAAAYQRGRDEEMVGSMIQEMGVRSSVIVSTKVWLRDQVRSPQARDLFRQSFESSLKRLRMDHVDILYYHLVDTLEDLRAEGPLQALAELKKEGKARSIGFSTHRAGLVLPEAAKTGFFDVALVAFNYTMASDQTLLETLDNAARSGLGIVAMKTQAGGLSRPDPGCRRTCLLTARQRFSNGPCIIRTSPRRSPERPHTSRWAKTSPWHPTWNTRMRRSRSSPTGDSPLERNSAVNAPSASAIAREARISPL